MPSEVIKDFRYDEQSRTLFIAFHKGDLYAYEGVEPATYLAMKRAISRGRFFMEHIRGRYAYGKVEDPSAVRLKPPEAPTSAPPDDPASPPPAGAGR
jgi:KTSC domain